MLAEFLWFAGGASIGGIAVAVAADVMWSKRFDKATDAHADTREKLATAINAQKQWDKIDGQHERLIAEATRLLTVKHRAGERHAFLNDPFVIRARKRWIENDNAAH